MTLFESPRDDIRPPTGRSPLRPSAAAHVGIALLAAALTALVVSITPTITLPELRPYTMSTELEQISDRIGFTNDGLDWFTDARPQLLADGAFVAACADPAEDSGDSTDDGWASIGCYIEDVGVYGNVAIFQPSDERLGDQVVVTAAHEFLHAAYARLSYDDRQALNTLLAARWALVPEDSLLHEEWASSVGSWKSNRATEQFAYLGTEVAEPFDPALEEYYSRYFRDRGAIVTAYQADQSLWERLTTDIETTEDTLAAQDETNIADETQLAADWAQLDADLALYNLEAEDANGDRAHLAQTRTALDEREAQLTDREFRLEEAEASTDRAWDDLERRYEEYDTLAAASVPAVD